MAVVRVVVASHRDIGVLMLVGNAITTAIVAVAYAAMGAKVGAYVFAMLASTLTIAGAIVFGWS